MIAKLAPIGSPKPCINAKKNHASSVLHPFASMVHLNILFCTFAFIQHNHKISHHTRVYAYSQSINGDCKALNNGGGGGGDVGAEMRTGRDNYEVPKCYDNIVKTPIELNSPLNRCVPQFRDEDVIECQFSACGCNFRTTDQSQLIVHNEENIHRHMNVSVVN